MSWSDDCEDFEEELHEELEGEVQALIDYVPVGRSCNLDLNRLAAEHAAHSPFKQSFILKELKSIVRDQIKHGSAYHDPIEFSLQGNILNVRHPHTGMYRGEEHEYTYAGAPKGSLPSKHFRREFLALEDVPYDVREKFHDPGQKWLR